MKKQMKTWLVVMVILASVAFVQAEEKKDPKSTADTSATTTGNIIYKGTYSGSYFTLSANRERNDKLMSALANVRTEFQSSIEICKKEISVLRKERDDIAAKADSLLMNGVNGAGAASVEDIRKRVSVLGVTIDSQFVNIAGIEAEIRSCMNEAGKTEAKGKEFAGRISNLQIALNREQVVMRRNQELQDNYKTLIVEYDKLKKEQTRLDIEIQSKLGEIRKLEMFLQLLSQKLERLGSMSNMAD